MNRIALAIVRVILVFLAICLFLGPSVHTAGVLSYLYDWIIILISFVLVLWIAVKTIRS